MHIPVQMLGQSGCRLEFSGITVYLDPYLSNSVQMLDSSDLERLMPIPIEPDAVTDADFVLITHDHIDHCDPHTLPKLAQASPQAQFIGPHPVLELLRQWGISKDRLMLADEKWTDLSLGLQVHAVPAAHPKVFRDGEGRLSCVGYVVEMGNQRVYLAGDTCVQQEIIDALNTLAPIHTAFLPVNEHNFFRGRRGIIGNMSVREAFQFASELGVQQVVAVHWDMFAANSADPEEIRLIYRRMNPSFSLLIHPTYLILGTAKVSVVIRTLNEAKHLDELLLAIAGQQTSGFTHEVVLIDSGSTDSTVEIAERHGCKIHHITREEFTFGRSLNLGCEVATGDVLVFISGHCVPADVSWLQRLCQPILDAHAEYTYGRQLGGPQSYLSEQRIFAKYFPESSRIPQQGYFCNNANSALLRTAWEKYRFNEDLTGLEDMELAQRLVNNAGRVAYVGDATVYHYHYETWPQVRRRFEREAIALQRIMPQVQVSVLDTLRYIASSIWKDWLASRSGIYPKCTLRNIVRYRCYQYWGAWRGNQEHRKLSRSEKEKYFYPS